MSKRAAKPATPRPPIEESPLRRLLREAPDRCRVIEDWFFSRPAVVARMASLPRIVRDEIRVEVRGRAMGAACAGRDRIDWTADDVKHCRARVVSRLRVARHGRLSDDPAVWAAQVAAIEAEIDAMETS